MPGTTLTQLSTINEISSLQYCEWNGIYQNSLYENVIWREKKKIYVKKFVVCSFMCSFIPFLCLSCNYEKREDLYFIIPDARRFTSIHFNDLQTFIHFSLISFFFSNSHSFHSQNPWTRSNGPISTRKKGEHQFYYCFITREKSMRNFSFWFGIKCKACFCGTKQKNGKNVRPKNSRQLIHCDVKNNWQGSANSINWGSTSTKEPHTTGRNVYTRNFFAPYRNRIHWFPVEIPH